MNETEATALLLDHLEAVARRPFATLEAAMGEKQAEELIAPSGILYTVEVEVTWDTVPGGALHLQGAIHDGAWRALAPVTCDFVIEREPS